MNICEDNHEPKYQVAYKPSLGGKYTPVWLVCENCMENKKYFGSADIIKSVKKYTEDFSN